MCQGRPSGDESPRCIEQRGALCNLIKEIVMATAKKAPAKKAPAKKAPAKKAAAKKAPAKKTAGRKTAA